MQMLYWFLPLVVVVYEVEAKMTGAPSSACDTMTPMHQGASGRGDNPMFNLFLSSSTYTPGSTITVTLRREGSSSFKGFLVEARTADPIRDQLVRYGQFSAGSNARIICSGDAITHVINDVKTEVTFNWTAPSAGEGDIEFRTSYVEHFTSFWVGVKSGVIRGLPSSTTTSSTTATPPLSTTSSSTTTTSSSTPPPPPTSSTHSSTTSSPPPTTTSSPPTTTTSSPPPPPTTTTTTSSSPTLLPSSRTSPLPTSPPSTPLPTATSPTPTISTSQSADTDPKSDTSTKVIIGDGGAKDILPQVCLMVLQFMLVLSLF